MGQPHHDDPQVVVETAPVPTWAKIVEPVVALVILWILFDALKTVFA